MTYEKSFKEEAVRLSDEIGVKKASEQLGDRLGGSSESATAPRHTSAAGISACRQIRKSSGSTSWKERTVSFSGQMRSCRRRSVFSP